MNELDTLVRVVKTWRAAKWQDDGAVAQAADEFVRALETEAENPGADKFAALADRKVVTP